MTSLVEALDPVPLIENSLSPIPSRFMSSITIIPLAIPIETVAGTSVTYVTPASSVSSGIIFTTFNLSFDQNFLKSPSANP